MSELYIGQRLMCVPAWQQDKQALVNKKGVRGPLIHHPLPARVVYINEAHRYYTVRYESSGLLESFKEG